MHAKVYDDLAKRGGSTFANWAHYGDIDKTTYEYFEMLYEIFERVYILIEDGWISRTEWPLWERWISNVGRHPLFRDVHVDNLGLFDQGFEMYIRRRLSERAQTSP
jgi:hypothetical protein